MANVYVGFHDRKSCSRILKPPGGGTSDIFNTSLEETSPAKTNNRSVTSPNKEPIATENVTKVETNGTEHKENKELVEPTPKETQQEEKLEIQPEEIKIDSLTISEKINEETKEEKKGDSETDTTQENATKSTTETLSSIVHRSEQSEIKTTVTEKRNKHRVPPGGYSSGLW